MAPSITYLITGANRGVGRAVADRLLAKPDTNTTLIALVRDPNNETSQSLLTQSKDNKNNKVILIAYDAASLGSAEKSMTELRSTHNINAIDVVFANAGYSGYFGPTLEAPPNVYQEVYAANAVAPMQLFQATEPFLSASKSPAFIAVSSATGSVTIANNGTLRKDTKGQQRRGATPYRASKAALNMIINCLAGEFPEIVFGVLTPGPTKTGFGGAGVNWDIIPGAQDVDTVADGLVKRIEEIKAKKGGDQVEFKDWKGDVFPW